MHSRRREGEEWSPEAEGTCRCGRRNSPVVVSYCAFARVLQTGRRRLVEQEETRSVSLNLFANPTFKQYFFFLQKRPIFSKKNIRFLSHRIHWACPGFENLSKQFSHFLCVSDTCPGVSVTCTCPTCARHGYVRPGEVSVLSREWHSVYLVLRIL